MQIIPKDSPYLEIYQGMNQGRKQGILEGSKFFGIFIFLELFIFLFFFFAYKEHLLNLISYYQIICLGLIWIYASVSFYQLKNEEFKSKYIIRQSSLSETANPLGMKGINYKFHEDSYQKIYEMNVEIYKKRWKNLILIANSSIMIFFVGFIFMRFSTNHLIDSSQQANLNNLYL